MQFLLLFQLLVYVGGFVFVCMPNWGGGESSTYQLKLNI